MCYFSLLLPRVCQISKGTPVVLVENIMSWWFRFRVISSNRLNLLDVILILCLCLSGVGHSRCVLQIFPNSLEYFEYVLRICLCDRQGSVRFGVEHTSCCVCGKTNLLRLDKSFQISSFEQLAVTSVHPWQANLLRLHVGYLWGCRYLHEVCSPPVVHRNFKSANILLDDDLNPHVSDCGLSALAPSSAESQVHIPLLISLWNRGCPCLETHELWPRMSRHAGNKFSARSVLSVSLIIRRGWISVRILVLQFNFKKCVFGILAAFCTNVECCWVQCSWILYVRDIHGQEWCL